MTTRPEPRQTAGVVRKSIFLDAMVRHQVVVLASLALFWGFYRSRMDWSADMRLWKAVGDVAFSLLLVAMAIGPAVLLWPGVKRLLQWRRGLGVWAAVAGSLHAYLVWDGWARWSLRRLFGFDQVPGIPKWILMESGFGLANLLGLTALSMMLILLATSSDRAVEWLGASTWKRLHTSSEVVLWLLVLHVSYFLFMHYELSLQSIAFDKSVPPKNWMRTPFLLAVGSVIALRGFAFFRTWRSRRGRREALA